MSNLLLKIIAKISTLISWQKPARKLHFKHAAFSHMTGTYWGEFLRLYRHPANYVIDSFVDYRGVSIKNKNVESSERMVRFVTVLEKDLRQRKNVPVLHIHYLAQSADVWYTITQGEEIISSKIRYAQKLADIDQRITVLEHEKRADKDVRLGQTRQLEYLEADVASLKRGEGALLGRSDDVRFASELEGILANVRLMEKTRDEPVEFEQARATFLSQVRCLEAQKQTREPYFADLLTMIDIGITYADESELTEESFAVLRDAVQCISNKITSDTLQELRKRFRNSGINILKPLDTQVNMGELLKEIFK